MDYLEQLEEEIERLQKFYWGSFGLWECPKCKEIMVNRKQVRVDHVCGKVKNG